MFESLHVFIKLISWSIFYHILVCCGQSVVKYWSNTGQIWLAPPPNTGQFWLAVLPNPDQILTKYLPNTTSSVKENCEKGNPAQNDHFLVLFSVRRATNDV